MSVKESDFQNKIKALKQKNNNDAKGVENISPKKGTAYNITIEMLGSVITGYIIGTMVNNIFKFNKPQITIAIFLVIGSISGLYTSIKKNLNKK